jgi:hypothetical protein
MAFVGFLASFEKVYSGEDDQKKKGLGLLYNNKVARWHVSYLRFRY